jgi:hypothetical protein
MNRVYLRKGFVAMTALVILSILAILGFSYWSVSRQSTDQILKEAHRIKARNFAQAGVEKVMINIANQYNMGFFDLDFPSKFTKKGTEKEYAVDFGDGRYQVESVQVFVPPGTEKKMFGVPYYKNRVLIGFYDIWKITVAGEVYATKVTARVETLIKIIRKTVDY